MAPESARVFHVGITRFKRVGMASNTTSTSFRNKPHKICDLKCKEVLCLCGNASGCVKSTIAIISVCQTVIDGKFKCTNLVS